MSDAELSSLRSDIADIDAKIFDLIKIRMELCEKVRKYKIERDMPTQTYLAESSMIEKSRARARKANLYEELITNLYLSLIKYSVLRQSELIHSESDETKQSPDN